MHIHGFQVIPQEGPNNICACLNANAKEGRQVVAILPMMMAPEVALAGMAPQPVLCLIFREEISDEDAERMFKKPPPNDVGPAEAAVKSESRILMG